jgi:intracellular multiplication protein IcmG
MPIPEMNNMDQAQMPVAPEPDSEEATSEPVRLPEEPDESTSRQLAAPASPPLMPAPAGNETEMSARTNMNAHGLESRLEEMAEKLERIESLANQANKKADKAARGNMTQNSTGSVSPAEIRSLKDTVAALERQVARLQSSPPRQADEARPSAAPARQPEPARKPPASASAKWELRAAQPGRAWIARAGSSEMQTIEIGDTVQGLGRISAISYTNGRWVIEGTQGNIIQ